MRTELKNQIKTKLTTPAQTNNNLETIKTALGDKVAITLKDVRLKKDTWLLEASDNKMTNLNTGECVDLDILIFTPLKTLGGRSDRSGDWVSVLDAFMNDELDVMISADYAGRITDNNTGVVTTFDGTYGLGIDEEGEPYTLKITNNDVNITLGLNTKMFYAIQFFESDEISEYFKELGYTVAISDIGAYTFVNDERIIHIDAQGYGKVVGKNEARKVGKMSPKQKLLNKLSAKKEA